MTRLFRVVTLCGAGLWAGVAGAQELAVPYDGAGYAAEPMVVKSYGVPAPVAEQPGAAPFPGAVWVPGYWYDYPLTRKWEWVPGYWTEGPMVAAAPPAPVVQTVVRPAVVFRPAPVVYRPSVRVVWGHRRWR